MKLLRQWKKFGLDDKKGDRGKIGKNRPRGPFQVTSGPSLPEMSHDRPKTCSPPHFTLPVPFLAQQTVKLHSIDLYDNGQNLRIEGFGDLAQACHHLLDISHELCNYPWYLLLIASHGMYSVCTSHNQVPESFSLSLSGHHYEFIIMTSQHTIARLLNHDTTRLKPKYGTNWGCSPCIDKLSMLETSGN